MSNLTRQELIDICMYSVVCALNWNDRDSYSAQVNIEFIYKGLMCGMEYCAIVDNECIDIEFKNVTQDQIDNTYKYNLNISSPDEYFDHYGYDVEMFDSYTRWGNECRRGYLPTRDRLNSANGGDWY